MHALKITEKRKRTVRDLLMRAPMPTIESAMNSERVRSAADASCLPQRPFARYVDGFGWVIDSVSAMHAEYNGIPDGSFDVTVMPLRYYA